MKKTYLVLLMLSLLILSCDNQEDSLSSSSKINQENFAIKNVEILNDLGNYFPKEDITFTISKDQEGKLFAIYKLIGQTRDEIDLGSFAKMEFERNDDGGTTCDSKWSCGRLLYQCLSNGDRGIISNGGCDGGDGYCVVCAPEEQ